MDFFIRSYFVFDKSVFLVDPALDAVLAEYKEKENSTNSEIEGNLPQKNRMYDADDEPDDNSGSEPVLPLDEEVIKRHRLSLEQIHAIPRFKDYQPGHPTEVLCIFSAVNVLVRVRSGILLPFRGANLFCS